jgi:hypothetical protein
MLLREYINHGTNIEKFSKFVSDESKKLIVNLKKNAYKIKNDITRIKINEVVAQLEHIQQKNITKDNHITALLIAYQISHELDSLS